jgi:hypothetical protein
LTPVLTSNPQTQLSHRRYKAAKQNDESHNARVYRVVGL